MKSRLEKDLEDMAKDSSHHTDLVQRQFLGVDIGNQNAFVNFTLSVYCGPFSGCKINIIVKVGPDYPYTPPEVYCHDSTFLHPNMDLNTRQIMFSLISTKHWKPTFELKQVICGLEMIMLTPETAYSSLRSSIAFKQALEEGRISGKVGRQMDQENCGNRDVHQFSNLNQRRPCSREPSYDRIHKPCTRLKIA